MPSEELPETSMEPTMIKVRSDGLKLDVILLQNEVSGLTIDYQNVSGSKELHKWLGIIDRMIFGPASSTEGPISMILGEVARVPAPQAQSRKEEQEELPESDYRRIVLQALDTSLDMLGRDGKLAILSLLENRFGLREMNIPDHSRGFVELLGVLLGTGAQVLEREIISNIRKVAAVPGENLYTIVESLKERNQPKVAAEEPAEKLSPVTIATTEEKAERSEEEKRGREISEDPIPSDFSCSFADPIPIGFKYNATYSRRRD